MTLRVRRGTAAQWAAKNPILAAGEPGFATDTRQLKVGDGATHFLDLPDYDVDAERVHGIDLWFYGDSLSVTPGVRCMPGKEYPTQLARLLQAPQYKSFAVGGSDAGEVAGHIIGGTPGHGFGAVVGSKWDNSKHGMVVLTLGGNDFAGYTDRSVNPPQPVATDQYHQAGTKGALRAVLAVLASSARVEFGTFSGTWGTFTDASQSAGSSRFSTNPGDYAEQAITVPAGTSKVWVLLAAWPQGGSTPAAAVNVSVDGTVVKSYTAAQLTGRRVKVGSSTYDDGTAYAVPLDVTPGAHTIRVTNAGTAGQAVSVDTILLASTTPPPVFWPRMYTPVASANQWNQAAIDVWKANRAILEPIMDAVGAEFSNVVRPDLSAAVSAAGINAWDGLHPNDRGMNEITEALYDDISQWLEQNDPDGLYYQLAQQTYPTNPQAYVQGGTWGLASTVAYRLDRRSMFYISGGTVSAISIDGWPTGLTSGSFLVPAGHTIAVTYTAAPSYQQFDAT